MRAAIAWLIVVTTITAWDPGLFGHAGSTADPFRDGKLRLLVYCLAPVLAWVLSARISPILCVLWAWWVCLWAYMGLDAYGWKEVALPPLFLLGARYVTRLSPVGTERALRACYLVQVLLALTQILGWAPPFDGIPSTEPMGTMGQFTFLGAFVACLVPYALFRWSAAEAFLGFLAVVSTGSAMSLAALGAATVAVFWKEISVRLAASTAALGLAISGGLWVTLPDNSFFNTSGRSYVWALAWERIKERPWGWGPGSWEGLYVFWNVPSVTPRLTWDRLHSDWLQLVFEGGWISGILAALFVAGFLVHTRSSLRAAIVAGLAVNALGNFPLHFAATAWLLCLGIAFPEDHEA